MDFVVVGFGLGALCILIGVAIYDWGPRLRRSTPPPTGDQRRDPVIVWLDGCRAAGTVLAIAGAFLWLVTLVPLVAHASDAVGGLILLVAVAVAGIVGIVVGGPFVWRRAHPAEPIGFVELAHRIRQGAHDRRLEAQESRRQAFARRAEAEAQSAASKRLAEEALAVERAMAQADAPATPEAQPPVDDLTATTQDDAAPSQDVDSAPTDQVDQSQSLNEPPTEEEGPDSSSANAPPPDEPRAEPIEEPPAPPSKEETDSTGDPERLPTIVASTPTTRTP